MSGKAYASLISAAVAMTVAVLALPAQAQDKVRWKMQSAFGAQLPHIGTSAVRFSKNVERLSGGKFEIKFYEPGALIPPLECFDAVSKGSIESCWTTPGYHTGKYPALAFFTTVPFGPPIGEFLGWKWFGGGNKLRDEIYAKHGLIAIDSFCHRARDLGLVPQRGEVGGRAQGHEDALLRPRRAGHAEARRVDAAAGGGRHLPGAGARRHRRHRVLHADHGHPAGLPPDRQVQLLPGLASAGLGQRVPDEQGGLGQALRSEQGDHRGRARRRSTMHTYVESEPRPVRRHGGDTRRSTASRSSAGATRTWRRSRRPGWKCWPRSRPRIRCSRRSPTTISTTARSSRCGARRRR